MSSYSRGPWSIVANGDKLLLCSGRDDQSEGVRICDIQNCHSNWSADMRALTAVPELIEALKAVLEDVGDLDMYASNRRGRTAPAFDLVLSALDKAGIRSNV